MQFTENEITIFLDLDPARYDPSKGVVLGGSPLVFRVGVSPPFENSHVDVTCFLNGKELFPRIGAGEIDGAKNIIWFKITLRDLSESGELKIQLQCFCGEKRIERTVQFRVIPPAGTGSGDHMARGISSISDADGKTDAGKEADASFTFGTSDAIRLMEKSGKTGRVRVDSHGPHSPKERECSRLLKDPVVEGATSMRPAFLVPCQIETRLDEDYLYIRVYPDQIAIDSLERSLTKEEVQDGQKFDEIQKTVEGTNNEKAMNAWRKLTNKYGNGRAAWIAKVVKEKEGGDGSDSYSIRNPEILSFPRIHILPKYFVVGLHLNTGKEIYLKGNEIDKDGKGLATISLSDEGLFGNDALWVSDFEKAFQEGMAFRMKRSCLGEATTVLKLTVVGVRPEELDEKNSSDLLADLFESHRYSSDAGFLRHGTATNSTEEEKSGYSTDIPPEERYEREFGADSSTGNNIEELAKALGLDQEIFSGWSYPHCPLRSITQSFHASLWPVTGDYFLNTFLKDLVDQEGREKLKEHFETYVRPLGYLPSIRIGKNPYGILPVMRLSVKNQGWDGFDDTFNRIVNALARKWLDAADSDKVPKVFSFRPDTTMDEELTRILAMSPESRGYRLRSFSEMELNDIIMILIYEYFICALLNQTGLMEEEMADLYTSLGFDIEDLLSLWTANKQTIADHLADFIAEISGDGSKGELILNSLLANIQTFSNYRESPYPLVRDSNETEENAEAATETDRSDSTNGSRSRSDTLLQRLLNRSVLLSGGNADIKERIEQIVESADDSALEANLKGVLDLFSYRLDAWISSLANKRLRAIRTGNNEQGILVGAYGIVENLSLTEYGEGAGEGGFIHAPSATQASTSAILKNAYLSYNDYEENPYRLNISSDRIRRALSLLEGVREGQELGALLGYQFERELHDNGLDEYLDEFRELFPFEKTEPEESPGNNEGEASEEESGAESGAQAAEVTEEERAAPRMVVNGLKLIAEGADYSEIIQQKEYEETIPYTNRKELIDGAVGRLRDGVDAIGDLMMHEAVYQAVNGNYERCGAALDTASGNSFPLEPESVSNPLPRLQVGHSISLVFNADEAVETLSPREKAEPKIARWFSEILGDMASIGCTVYYHTFEDVKEEIDGENKTKRIVSESATGESVPLSKLALRPIDFLYLSAHRPGGGATELEGRIKKYLRTGHANVYEDDTIKIRIDFGVFKENSPGFVPLEDAIEFANQVLLALGASSYLKPDQLYKKGKAPDGEDGAQEPAVNTAFSRDDFIALYGRVHLSYISLEGSLYRIRTVAAPVELAVQSLDALHAIPSLVRNLTVEEGESYPPAESIADAINEMLSQSCKDFQGVIDDPFRSDLESRLSSAATAVAEEGEERKIDAAEIAASLLEEKLIDALSDTIAELLPGSDAEDGVEVGGDLMGLRAIIDSASSLSELAKGIFAKQGENIRPLIKELRKFGVSIDFHRTLTPAMILSIKKRAEERFEKANAILSSLVAQQSLPDPNEDPDEIVARLASPISYPSLIEKLVLCMKAIFGDNFIVIPEFAIPEYGRVSTVLEKQEEILRGNKESRVFLWLQQVAQTHKKVEQFEEFLLFTESWGSQTPVRFRPSVLPLPLVSGEGPGGWQALSNEELGIESSSQRDRGTLGVVIFSSSEKLPERVGGLHIDQWEETLPLETLDTAISFQADTPNQKPPNCCLLAIPGEPNPDSYWNIRELEAIVCDALNLAKIRSVDMDALPDVAGLFPALFLPKEEEQDLHIKLYETIRPDAVSTIPHPVGAVIR